jgi:hypothetical protein
MKITDEMRRKGKEALQVRNRRKMTCGEMANVVLEAALSHAPSGAGEAVELNGVADALEYGKGFWRSCSGCHNLNEGVPTGPYSNTMKCYLGGGCFECGGIGAVWDTTDYAEMGRFMAEDVAALPATEEKAADVKVKPLDLSNLMKHAFFHGAGLGDMEKASDDLMQRWCAYDPEGLAPYNRIVAALASPIPAPPSDWFSKVVSFFVEHGMLDAREEYDIDDVMAALADNYVPAPPSELEARCEALEKAVEPLALLLDAVELMGGPSRLTRDDDMLYQCHSSVVGGRSITLGDMKRARAALANGGRADG